LGLFEELQAFQIRMFSTREHDSIFVPNSNSASTVVLDNLFFSHFDLFAPFHRLKPRLALFQKKGSMCGAGVDGWLMIIGGR